MFRTVVVCTDNGNTHKFFCENFAIYDNVEKYVGAGGATDDSIMWCRKDMICMLDD